MSLQLELKYINLLKSRLKNFKRKKPTLFQFSCPICGDSEKDKKKARGNFFQIENHMKMHCYNCDVNMSIQGFLKAVDIGFYEEYMRELLLEKKEFVCEEFTPGIKRPMYEKASPLSHLVSIDKLNDEHHAKKYLNSRLIPEHFLPSIYYVPKFFEFINTYIEKDKFSEKSLKNFDHDRIIFPLIDKSGKMHGLQGRSFIPNDPSKYITIVTDDSVPKLFGLDRVNFNKQIYVLEGPIDSLFVNNSLASCGGNISSSIKGFDKDKFVIVYDNEPRKKETIEKLNSAIDSGYKVLIYPENLKEKDINNMIINKELSINDVDKMIKNNVYSGLTAKLKLTKWSKL